MKIKVRQICFIMIAYTAVTKLLIYPTALAELCGRDLLFPALINFLIEGLLIWAVSFLCSRTDKTFFELIEGTLGNIGARIVYGFMAAFFMLSAIIPLFEQKLYVHTIFYDTVPTILVFLPVFIFTVYAASKKFENIGRCADICLPVFLAVTAFLFLMAVGEAQWDNLMPILQTPATSVLRGASSTAIRFMQPCWMLMFMGHFKYRKGDAAKITLSYAAGAAIVLLFLAMFYGIYGEISASRTFAVSRISIFFPAIETIGRIDLIMLYVLEVVMLFALAINIQFAVHALMRCTGYGNRKVLSLAVNGALLLVVVFCAHYFHAIQIVFYRWLWIVTVVFAVLVPALSWLLKRRNADEK